MRVSNENENKRIARNSVFLSIRMVIVLFLQLYTTRIVLRVLGVEDYGIYNVVCGFVSMFTFLSSAMTNGIQRFYNYELGKNGFEGANNVFNAAVRVQAVLAVVLIASTEILGLWYLNNKMVIPPERLFSAHCVFQSSILSFIFIILCVPYSGIVIAQEKMNFYAVISVMTSFFGLVIAIILSFVGHDKLVLYGILLAVVQLLVLVCYILYSKKHFKFLSFQRENDKNLLRSILGFSGWNMFGTFANIMKEQGINMVLNLFCGPVVNAARGVAAQVNGGFQSLVSNLNMAVRPQVTKSYAQGNIDRTMNLTYCVSKLSSIVLYLISYPILLEINYVLSVWLGDKVPEHTAMFIIIVCLTSFLNNLNSCISGVVHSTGKMKRYQTISSAIHLLAIPIAYYVLKMGYEPEYALWVTFASMIICQISALFILKTIVDYSIVEYFRVAICPFVFLVLVTIVPPFLVHSALEMGFVRFVIVVSFSMFEILIVAYFVALSKPEQALFKDMFIQLKTLINN